MLDTTKIPTPSDVLKNPHSDVAQKASMLLDRVCQAMKTWAGETQLTIATISYGSAAANRVVEALRCRGWFCDFVSDQRDGDFISIKPPAKPR